MKVIVREIKKDLTDKNERLMFAKLIKNYGMYELSEAMEISRTIKVGDEVSTNLHCSQLSEYISTELVFEEEPVDAEKKAFREELEIAHKWFMSLSPDEQNYVNILMTSMIPTAF